MTSIHRIQTASSLIAGLLLTLLQMGCGSSPETELESGDPNIILVITDDQGWAQVGSHGNETIQTPHLDRLASQSVEFTRFYVSPVCAPTRASLMTGRYNYRTGVVDTYVGRAMMYADEVTLAERLSHAGYRTGIFGKWHLGDNYPMRSIDQGFQESLVHKGGGIGQPSDPQGNSYFDPILQLNGKPRKYEGYCTDIFFDAALEFIQDSRQKPFFVYIPTNAPHSPYDVPDSYIQPYLVQGLTNKDARIYGMITNIDDNIGRLISRLEELKLSENTLLIFMTDNGPTTQHFTAGLRGMKTTVYDGGIRVPFFLRWPARLQPDRIEEIAAHIDLMPTLLEAAGVEVPTTTLLDGISLLPRLEGREAALPERTIYIQSHRGNVPQLYRNFAAVGSRYKLLQPLSFSEKMPAEAELELYDLEADPGENRDLFSELPEVADRMRRKYESWFREVSATRSYLPPQIAIGTKHENPVILTRQDWQMVGKDGWGDSSLGYWELSVAQTGTYEISFRFGPFQQPGEAELKVQDVSRHLPFKGDETQLTFESVQLASGNARLEARLHKGEEIVGARYVDITALAP